MFVRYLSPGFHVIYYNNEQLSGLYDICMGNITEIYVKIFEHIPKSRRIFFEIACFACFEISLESL